MLNGNVIYMARDDGSIKGWFVYRMDISKPGYDYRIDLRFPRFPSREAAEGALDATEPGWRLNWQV